MTALVVAAMMALSVGMATYALLPRRDPAAAVRQVAGLTAAGNRGALIDARIRARSLVQRVFPRLSSWLYWEQVRGRWRGWTEETVLVVQVGLGLAALALALATRLPSLFSIALVTLSSVALVNRLHSGFQDAQKRIERELPMVAMALATAAERGIPIASTLRALAAIGSQAVLFPRWLTNAMASCPAATPLMEWLQEQARRAGIPALVGFARTLYVIERQGKGHEELYTLAQQVSNDYLAGVQRRTKQLDDRLSLAVGLFYFIPYIVLVAAPIFGGFASR